MTDYIIRETSYPGAIKQKCIGELIRCADCIYWEPDPDNTITPEAHRCRRSPMTDLHTEAWEYCSRAKTKEEK